MPIPDYTVKLEGSAPGDTSVTDPFLVSVVMTCLSLVTLH